MRGEKKLTWLVQVKNGEPRHSVLKAYIRGKTFVFKKKKNQRENIGLTQYKKFEKKKMKFRLSVFNSIDHKILFEDKRSISMIFTR